jgi:hypothetical protein
MSSSIGLRLEVVSLYLILLQSSVCVHTQLTQLGSLFVEHVDLHFYSHRIFEGSS